MRFRVKFTEEAEDQFFKLPKSAQKMIKDAIKDRLETEPLAYGKPLRFSYSGHRRIRVSKYRIIYRIMESQVLVIIVNVDHRKDVYKE